MLGHAAGEHGQRGQGRKKSHSIEPFRGRAHHRFVTTPSDAALVSSAHAGDAAALGALIARHRASMIAIAVGLLGHRPEAEDAVQDAVIAALANLHELRDPNLSGAWLRAIVRNNCLMSLRRRRSRAAHEQGSPEASLDPEELFDRHALRGWLFRALDSLSEPLQLVVLLRYFTDLASYQQIASFSGVPVGTVRSRLSEAKRKLAELLLSEASDRHDELEARTERRVREAAQVLAEAEQGRFSRVATTLFEPGVSIVGPTPDWGTDLRFLIHAIDHDRERGVRHVLRNVVCGKRLTIWEMDLVSPPGCARPCPPSIVWAHFAPNGRTRHVRLFHSQREA
jgi:RNA polymerase sigma-70 factor (ECF subfamily)